MLRQYFATKERYPGVLLAMRVGDFYEFYGEDAETAARALQITLTGREDGPNGKVAMAGVPFHSVEKYLARLIQSGFKVALCDQVEDPKLAKGLVKREVTRVLTPGTVVEDAILDSGSNNFLASAAPFEEGAGIGFLDLSTGEFLVTQITGDDAHQKTLQEIARLSPAECLLPEEADELYDLLEKLTRTMVTRVPLMKSRDAKARLLKQFGTNSLTPFGLEDLEGGTAAAGAILRYLDENEIESAHVDSVTTYSLDSRMRLDGPTARSLELTQNMSDGGKRMTLLEVLDHTRTPMGARTLRRWVQEPLLEQELIERRLDSVDALFKNGLGRDEVRTVLGNLYDIQRLVARAATAVANARDLVAIRDTLAVLPELVECTHKFSVGRIAEARRDIDPCPDLLSELTKALADDPPISLREGGLIRKGYDPELDELRRLSSEGKEYIAGLERKERERSGIERLKVGYNSVFGYYLEVPKSAIPSLPATAQEEESSSPNPPTEPQSQKASSRRVKAEGQTIPADYIRKQTTANAERYITAELKEYESKVLGSEEKAFNLEYQIFTRLRALVGAHASSLLRTARAIADIDSLQSLAEAAVRESFTRPTFPLLSGAKRQEEGGIVVRSGRHPVVEHHLGFGAFVPNDTSLNEDCAVVILTGPNMSGKSTYLRQTALIVLMAQIGSFVPAQSAEIQIVDRVFARIGARDELASGQSTFMVEMTEAANILHHATDRSLVILDEIGRGTSTYDGLAIAWAIAERLAQIGAKTLFATHYHQLNALAEQMPNVRNYRVAVREEGDQVIWLHKVLEGGTDRSYGIQVARMAGLPRSVLQRASEVLADLEGRESSPLLVSPEMRRGLGGGAINPAALQMALFEAEESEVVRRLKSIDTSTLTPVEALVLLDNLKRESAK
jgi:DNA mismatch repair protein MutS